MEATQTKHRKARIVLIVLAIVVVVAMAAGAWYVNDFYHADQTAIEACQPDAAMDVSATSATLAFGNADTARAGLVFYPGAKVQAESYAPLMRAIASHGIYCVIAKMPFNLALFDIDAASNVMAAHPEVPVWYVSGHSLGGSMASVWASSHADRIAGIIFFASYPAADLSKTDLRALSLYGSNDTVLNRSSYDAAASSRPDDFTEQVLEGGNHAGFGDYGKQAGDGQATISPEDQQDQAANAVVAFIEQSN